jgi:predicted Kef-type K+ transport protein
VFGLSLSVASTVVLLRALEARDLLKSENGRIAVGWLIVEDLVVIVVLILFPALAYALGAETGRGATAEGANAEAVAPGEVVWKLARTLTQLGLFVAFMLLVGMLFDPGILLRQPLQILLVVAIILVAKTVAAAVLVRLLGRPWHTALLISVALAQIGEFSFLLGSLGLAYGLLSKEGQNLIVAGSLLSIMLNPALFAALDAWVTPGPNSEPHPASAG